jgi:uncharacterized protein (DUF2236 family)/predicted metal-dependent HD superfamily phosphohydrolase
VARIRERLSTALFSRVAGPDGEQHRARIHGTPGPRWFAPGSPITRVHGDASMYVGGIRAVLLQTMQPQAMTAVAEHSGYRGDMWGRLARTSRFIAVTTFGTVDDAQQAVDVVRAIHDRVTGVMPDGTAYDANDPHLLEWVHVAEIQSFLLAHQRYGARPLDQAGCDEYVAQTALVARKLGVLDPPTSEAALHAAVDRYRPELVAIDHARDAVEYLIKHPELPRAARPAYGVLVAAAVGLMPEWTRKPLGLPTLPVAHDRVADALGRLSTRTIRWATTGDRDLTATLRAGRDALVRRWPLNGHEETRDALLAAYGDGSRGYHDVRHLTEVLDRLDELAGAGADVDLTTLALAAWFHDAVYDGRPDAEERSATWAEEALAGSPYRDEVARLVRLTEAHDPADDDLPGQALCDADLAILASERLRYDEYVAGVRRDFAHVSDADFAAGRAAVLRDLLGRDRLFCTPYGQERWEHQARLNLGRELDRLEGAAGSSR